MVTESVAPLAVLAVLSVVGCVFVFDGYNLVDTLLAWTGWLVGAGAGGAVAWFFATSSGSPDRLLVVGVAVVAGAVAGRILVPLVSWLAVVLLGFSSTSAAAVFVLAGPQLSATIARLDTSVSSPRDVELLVEQLAAAPVLQQQQFLAMAAFAGLVGAILAAKYYAVIVTAGVTTAGAALLAVVVPLWEPALAGSLTVAEPPSADVANTLFVGLLVVGLLVQGYRYGEELGVPVVGSKYDPLEGN